jgi:hypothetical protein
MTDPIELSIPTGTRPGDVLVITHIDASGDEPVATSYRLRLPTLDEHTTAAHLTDLAAFVRRQRAEGWREAVAALRDVQRLGPFVAEYRTAECERRPLRYAPSSVVLAAFLESLAPKETP